MDLINNQVFCPLTPGWGWNSSGCSAFGVNINNFSHASPPSPPSPPPPPTPSSPLKHCAFHVYGWSRGWHSLGNVSHPRLFCLIMMSSFISFTAFCLLLRTSPIYLAETEKHWPKNNIKNIRQKIIERQGLRPIPNFFLQPKPSSISPLVINFLLQIIPLMLYVVCRGIRVYLHFLYIDKIMGNGVGRG